MTTLFNYLLIFNVFAGGFVLFSSPFEFYLGYIFILFFLILYIFRYHTVSINVNFLAILIVSTIFSLLNIYYGNNTIFFLIKQVMGILITGLAYYLLIKINKYEINKLFKIYLQIALIVAAIGIFQEFSFLVGFRSGYDYSWIIQKWKFTPGSWGMLRVNSIFSEPAHLATSMAPALFISLAAILKNNTFYLSKKAAVLIIICFVLTFSAVAYMAILISLLAVCFNLKKLKDILIIMLLMIILFYGAYRFIPEIQVRVNHTVKVATGSMSAAKSNLSVYALASNAFIAYKSFLSNPLFGRGLGSHPISYGKFIFSGASRGFWQKDYPFINREDAASLFLRLISEMGLFGIIAVFYFVFKFRLKNNEYENLEVLSSAVLILFIVQLLRLGHYFFNGLFFFVWLYYFAYKIYHTPGSKIPEIKSH